MPETDLALLIEAAKGAGEIAMRHSGPTARVWDKPGGLGPVTEADLEVNAYLADVLQSARPGHGWLSEESEDSAARLERDEVFIVDPIDGTRSFIEGSRTWAHALAITHRGKVVAGVIYLPARDRLYAAAKGQGATLNGAPIRVGTRDDLDGAEVLAAKPVFAPEHWRADVPAMTRGFRPSLAYRLGLVAEGRFDAMFTLRPSWEWDIAAGALILSEAGAVISDRRGKDLRFNNRVPQLDGVVAANAQLHNAILDALL